MIETLGNIGDFISGIAVLITLIYLSIQIRANTKAIHSASRERVAKEYREVLKHQADPDSVKAMARGFRSYPDISFEDMVLFGTRMHDESLFFQAVFAQFEAGHLEKETYQGYLDNYASAVSTTGGRKWYEECVKPIYIARMVEAVDQRLLEGNLFDLLSQLLVGEGELLSRTKVDVNAVVIFRIGCNCLSL